MTAKCANPACSTVFRYFRAGKIFLIDIWASNGVFRSNDGLRTMEYFWLCGECSRSMQVTVNDSGLVVVDQVGKERVSAPSESIADNRSRERAPESAVLQLGSSRSL